MQIYNSLCFISGSGCFFAYLLHSLIMREKMNQPQIILITGASSGFGKACAGLLALRGHQVYGTSRKQLPDQGAVRMLQLDVTDPESIRKALNSILEKHQRLDVLINNAGIGISGALELATPQETEQQINTNFLGMTHVCRAVLPLMRRARAGKIINISSIAGLLAIPYQGFYSASKFAIEGYSEALAMETAGFGIRVCLVEPGDAQTGFTTNRTVSEITRNHPDYRESFGRAMQAFEKSEQKGIDPQKLAKAVCRLVERKKPPFRTIIGPAAQVFFAHCRNWMPIGWRHYLIRKLYVD